MCLGVPGFFYCQKRQKSLLQMVRGQIGKNKINEGSRRLLPVCKSAAIFRHKAIGTTVSLNFVKNIAIFLCILRIICYNRHIPRRGCGVMGGYFAAVSKEDCVFDLFFGRLFWRSSTPGRDPGSFLRSGLPLPPGHTPGRNGGV